MSYLILKILQGDTEEDSMEFYEIINSRKTIREFENENIPEEIIERIISAAFKAPTKAVKRSASQLFYNLDIIKTMML